MTMEQRCAEFKVQKLAEHVSPPLDDKMAVELDRIRRNARIQLANN